MTSWRVTASMASIAATSMVGFVSHQRHSAVAASAGTVPRSASAWVACASSSNQIASRLSGDQMAVISGRA